MYSINYRNYDTRQETSWYVTDGWPGLPGMGTRFDGEFKSSL